MEPKTKEPKPKWETWICNFCECEFQTQYYKSPSRCPYCGSTSEIKEKNVN
jgi:predicted Zn-ribbon and HTH transcriptional regulator